MISLPSTDTNNFQTQEVQQLSHPIHTQYQDVQSHTVTDDVPDLDFDSDTAHALLASNLEFFNNSSVSRDSELMQSDTWGGLAHFTPKIGRFSHHRESSLSSLGSTGPASPFNSNTSNPHIAVTDPSFDGLDYPASQTGTYYQLAKTIGPSSYDGYQALEGGIDIPEMGYPVTVPGPDKRQRLNKGLLPAPEFSGAYNKSYPTSVTSSVGGGDSPATPAVGESDHSDRRRTGYTHIPKLDRTMTDVYGDELYNPNFAITSGLPSQPHSVMSSTSDVFNQRLSAANSHHLSAAQSPASTASRARSPFRNGSPFTLSPAQDMTPQHNGHTFNSTHNIRDQNQNQQRPLSHVESAGEPETPKTISPKDAVLEFNEVEADGMFPLFAHDSSNFQIDTFSKPMGGAESDGVYFQAHASGGPNDQFGFIPSQLPTGIQVPQQYPFVSRPSASHETPPRLSSSGPSSVASAGHTPNTRPRPLSTGAESGTYTCTYHGCTMRFETPSLLQKHKREGHRQTQGLGAPRVQDMGMTATVLNTQAGPHRCDRINPSTGKPCNTVFSRPYDLTRHEDTIHNARKQKVRCNLCTEEKSFSRADALTRHYRVCHPDMDLPGRTRRRGGG